VEEINDENNDVIEEDEKETIDDIEEVYEDENDDFDHQKPPQDITTPFLDPSITGHE